MFYFKFKKESDLSNCMKKLVLQSVFACMELASDMPNRLLLRF